eukprot:771994-Rhodomonas_salina.1
MVKTLKLVIAKKPFEVMVTGEKCQEYRRMSKWMSSRLFNKDGTIKDYDYIQFTNGYGADRPSFTGEGVCIEKNIFQTYSTGFK